MKIIEWLEEKCKKTFGKAFIENYGILLILSAFYNVNWVYTCSSLSLMLLYSYQYSLTAYYCLFVRTDFALLAEAMYFGMATILCFLFQFGFLAARKPFTEFIRSLDEGIHNYGDTIDPLTRKELDSLIEKYDKQGMSYTRILYKTYFFTGFLNLYVVPILSGRFSLDEDDEYITRRSMIMKITPYYSKSGVGWYINLLLDLAFAMTIVFVHNAIQIPFISLAQHACKELAIVTCTMKNVFIRAKYVFKKKYGWETDTYKSWQFHQCLSECMKDTVKHHIAIMRCYKKFTKAYSPLVFVVFLAGASLLCTSAMVLLSKTYDMTMKVAYITYVPEEMFNSFVFAYYGERLAQLCSSLYEEVYFTKWEEASKTMLPYVNMVQSYTRSSKILVTGLGFVDYNLKTFGNILSSAYSYINVMSASGNF